MATAQAALQIDGDKLYQQRARMALPILVRQAQAGSTIVYGDLAQELDMPMARNLNAVLGGVGRAITKLSKEWEQKIPATRHSLYEFPTGLY